MNYEVNVNELEEALTKALADFICIDIPHGVVVETPDMMNYLIEHLDDYININYNEGE